jgi:hypothetical protein
MGNYYHEAPASRVIATQTIQSTGGSTAYLSNGVGTQTYQVRLTTNIPGGARVKIDSGATATVGSDTWLAPNVQGEIFACSPGMTISGVSSATSTGWLNISEMS